MGLLQDIIDGATGTTTSTTQLLRMVRVLAARGRADDLAAWVRQEQAGYAADDPLPPYRGPFPSPVTATLNGPVNLWRKIGLPQSGWPSDFKALFTVAFRQPLVQLESWAERDDLEALNSGFHWSADALVRANQLMEQGKVPKIDGFVLTSAYSPITKGQLVAVIGGVRDRILDLALSLEGADPDLGSVATTSGEEREAISAKFNLAIYANNVNLAETISTNNGVAITTGDTDSLRRYLDALGFDSPSDREELVAAAEAARASGSTNVEQDGRLRTAVTKVGSKLGWAAATTFVQGLVNQWLGA